MGIRGEKIQANPIINRIFLVFLQRKDIYFNHFVYAGYIVNACK